ncbi:MAG: carbohydrate kinase family protein [Mangrovicoccus sp.]
MTDMPDILCCGEALIDMLPRQLDGQTVLRPTPGGAVYNTAVALGRLGVKSGLFTGLSTDLFGTQLAMFLAESGVSSDLAHRSARPTTLAFVELRDGQARYSFYDEATAGRMLCPEDLPDLGTAPQALFAGGISLMSEPCATAYEALVLREAPKRTIMLDPNIRPGFITDEPAYRARLGRMLAVADIVKVSDEDLAWIAGPEAGPQALLDRGPRLVFITRGGDGAEAVTAQHSRAASPPKVSVTDTVGAGDTFNAGAMAALLARGKLAKPALAQLLDADLDAALSLACRAAAVTVTRAGANPPWANELEPQPA